MGRGLLVFKGDKKANSKSKNKKKKSFSSTQKNNAIVNKKDVPVIETITASINKSTADIVSSNNNNKIPKIEKGSGKIISSGTVITGISTKFRTEFTAGDALIIHYYHSDSQSSHQKQQKEELTQEMRVVTMCLSDTSCAISSAFSNDLKQPMPFSLVRKPRDEDKEREKAFSKQKEEWMETERTAFGTYESGTGHGSMDGGGRGGNGILVYREKTETGSYVIKKEELNTEVTRDELLNMRAKKKSDRYC